MANDEELIQRGLLDGGKLKGKAFGDFEEFDLGGTFVETLRRFGMSLVPPDAVDFPFKEFKPPRNPKRAKPDVVFAVRRGSSLVPVAVRESKGSAKIAGERGARPNRRSTVQQLWDARSASSRTASNGDTWM